MSEVKITDSEAMLALLIEAIEEAPIPLSIYDAQDRLLVCSAAYRALHAPALDDYQSGTIGGDATLQSVMTKLFNARFSPTEAA